MKFSEIALTERKAAMLPATRALWNKGKVTLSELSQVWDEVVVYICYKHGSQKPGSNIRFLTTPGKTIEYPINSLIDAYHDQTRAFIGRFQVVNTAYVVNGQIVESSNDQFLNHSAPVLVFK